MKIISKNFKLLTVFLLVLGLTACSDDDDNNLPPTEPMTIVDVAIENNLTSLAAALEATDLVSTLQSDGPFTVFAPTNDAFSDFLTEANIDLSNMTATEIVTVRNVLSNHVIAGATITSTDLIGAGSGYVSTEAAGVAGNNMSLFYNFTEGSVVLNGMSTVTTADVTASNGIVHVVDEVITLPSIVTFATADPNFSSLVEALTADDQPDFVTTLSLPIGVTPTPFTVFAPVNSAFQALLDSNDNWNSIENIDSDLLTSVLEHHVITEANVRSEDLSDGMMPTTLEGDMITINLPGNDGNPAKITDGAGNTDIDIIAVDVQAINGVIHAVETVLLPDTTN
ncbi:MAG: fasciclin domain-containing protein [Winogradskyella arenosi]